MDADELRGALSTLGWSQERAARELGVCNRQRISSWCRAERPVPDYIAAHVRTQLALQRALTQLHQRSAEPNQD